MGAFCFIYHMSETPETPKVFPGPAIDEEQPVIPTVPEAVLRKKKSIETYKINKEARLIEIAKKKAEQRKKKIQFKRAEQIVLSYRKTANAAKRSNRLLTDGKELKIEEDVKVVLVVRVTGKPGRDMDDRTTKILNSFRLTQVNQARLLQLTDSTKKLIRVVEPFVTYGYQQRKQSKILCINARLQILVES